MQQLQPNVQVNLAQVQGALDALKTRMADKVGEAFKAAHEYAQDGSPVGTPQSTGDPNYVGGTNKKSITIDGKGMERRIYTQSGYGGWLEIGTEKMAARPYIMPGFTRAVKELEGALEGIA